APFADPGLADELQALAGALGVPVPDAAAGAAGAGGAAAAPVEPAAAGPGASAAPPRAGPGGAPVDPLAPAAGAAGEDPRAAELRGLLRAARERMNLARPALPLPPGEVPAAALTGRLREELVGRILAAADTEGGGDPGAAFWAVPDAAGEGRRGERDRGRPPTHVVAARFPGVLAQQALRRMEGHMRGVAAEDLLGGGLLNNVIRAYLVTSFFGARPAGEAAVGLRNPRELKTIAAIIEAILQGRILTALDIAVQRFKAIELSIEEGNWTNARWLELIPVNTVGTYDRGDLRDARREEEQDRAPLLGAAVGAKDRSGLGEKRRRGHKEAANGEICVHSGVHILVGDLGSRTSADGSVYVGGGVPSLGLPRSYWAEWGGHPGAEALEREALLGRSLRVGSRLEAETAKALIDRLDLGRGASEPVLDIRGARRRLAEQLSTGASVAQLGAVLVEHIEGRPGGLGELSRLWPCGAWQDLAGPGELLPVPRPTRSTGLVAALAAIRSRRGASQSLPPVSREVGIDAWVELTALVTNYGFLGGPRLLAKLLKYPAEPSPAQVQALARFRRFATILVDEGDPVNLAPSAVVEQRASELYWGEQVTRAFPLTLDGILPGLPSPEVAAQVELADLLSGPAREVLLDPSILRLPEDEVQEPLPKARVLVESKAEYYKIVEALCKLGVMEAEVPEETWTHRGVPVRNGLFGVHKSWKQVGNRQRRVLRLIVNLVPTNALQRHYGGAAKAMGYPGLWPLLVLHPDEIQVHYSEDQSGCFHLYGVPRAWRGAFVIEEAVPGEVLGLPGSAWVRPRLRTCPMGWVNAVAFIQEAHENLVTGKAPSGAGISADLLVRMGHRAPSSAGLPRNWFSVYVDNWDQGKVVLETEAEQYVFKPSGEQLAVRAAYAAAGVRRAPEKSAEGAINWETLGAQLRGADRLVGTSPSRRSYCLGRALGHLTAERVRDDDLLSDVGRITFMMQFGRGYFSFLGRIFRELSVGRLPGPLGGDAADELLAVVLATPLLWTDLAAQVSGEVVATDASETGGGACVSAGLSPKGVARLGALRAGAPACPSDILVVSVFDATGGAAMALDLLGITPCGIIAVEPSKVARGVVRAAWPQAFCYPDASAVTHEEVLKWSSWYPQARRILQYSCMARIGPDSKGPISHLEVPLRISESLRRHAAWGVADLIEYEATIAEADVQEVSRQVSEKAWKRCVHDLFRHPAHHYEDKNLVADRHGPRRLKADEQIRMLGFRWGHFRPVERLSPKTGLEDAKAELVSSACPIVIARMVRDFVLVASSPQPPEGLQRGCIDDLWTTWARLDSEAQRASTRKWTEAHGGPAISAAPAPASAATDSRLAPEAELVQEFIRLADHRGSDIRLDAGLPHRFDAWPRAPLDAGLWTWRVALSYAFRNQQHINVLEATAVLDFLRSHLKLPKHHGKRKLFLLDSQAAIGALTKGRSSSNNLNQMLLRIAAISGFANFRAFYGWVPSKGNPADGPSRWKRRRLEHP
ncbi:unnamed protein product, partial [Prorocentrum cordatum]